jgi:diguanylate cyclase (GGDEF)-like protein/PAS domain S-box-containing protein
VLTFWKHCDETVHGTRHLQWNSYFSAKPHAKISPWLPPPPAPYRQPPASTRRPRTGIWKSSIIVTYAHTEQARLTALAELEILDTPAETRFDRFTRLAAMTFGVPIALVSLVDENRQWFKSRHGLAASETPRAISFCAHTVASGDMLVVEDATLDRRFSDNPLVTGEPGIRFYAGQPVCNGGQPVGTLAIIDTAPRQFSAAQRQVLQDLAEMVEVELNHMKEVAARMLAEQALKSLNTELEHRIAARTVELEEKVVQLSHEVAQREAAEALLRQSETWNRTIIASSYSGFIGADSEGRVVDWNPSAERIFGWSGEQARGRMLSELIIPAHLRQEHETRMQRMREIGSEPYLSQTLELPALTRTGRQITVQMAVASHEWNGACYVSAFVNDVSERIRTQQELEEKQQLLDAVLESIDVGVVACDAVGNLTLFNRAARVAHGQEMKAVASAEWPRFYSLYHADGRTAMAMDEVPLVRALKGDVVRDEAMVIAPGGSAPVTLIASGRPLRNAQGKTLGAVVAMKDVSELRASRDRLVESEERLRTITDNLPVLIAHLDQDHRYVFANAVHQSWLGKAPEQVVGQTMIEAFGEQYWAQQQEALQDAWDGKAAQCEHDIVRKKHIRIVHSTFLPHLRDGKVVGIYILTTDATAARMHERNLHALAHTDALTGIPNRRQFELALQAAVQHAPQRERAFALLYLDIDHFKQINDSHGHAVGDMVLVEFARRVRNVVRSSDLVARLAGDEFTVLLEEVNSPRDAELVAKKIMQAMEAPFVAGGQAIAVGATIGVGLADAPGVSSQSISELADGALYEAKRKGRNTFALARLADTVSLDDAA